MGVLETIISKMDSPNDIRMGAYQIEKDTRDRRERNRNRLQDNLWALGNAFQAGAEKRKDREHDFDVMAQGEEYKIAGEERMEDLYRPPEGQEWNVYTVNGKNYRWNDKRTYDLIPEAIRADIEASRADALYDRDRDDEDQFGELWDSIVGTLSRSSLRKFFTTDDFGNDIAAPGPYTQDELDELYSAIDTMAQNLAPNDPAMQERLRSQARIFFSSEIGQDTPAEPQGRTPRGQGPTSRDIPMIDEGGNVMDQQFGMGFTHPGNEVVRAEEYPPSASADLSGVEPEGGFQNLMTKLGIMTQSARAIDSDERAAYDAYKREIENITPNTPNAEQRLQYILDAIREMNAD